MSESVDVFLKTIYRRSVINFFQKKDSGRPKGLPPAWWSGRWKHFAIKVKEHFVTTFFPNPEICVMRSYPRAPKGRTPLRFIRGTGIERRGAAIRGENGKQSELVRTNSGCLPFSFFVFGTRKRQTLWRHPYESAS